jgi:hypothetical protein
MKNFLIVIAVIVGIGVAGVMYGISVNNTFISQKNAMETKLEDNKQILSNVMMTIKKISEIVKKSSDFQKEFTLEKFKARYGEKGVKGVINWIQEAVEPADISAYNKLMVSLEAELKRFEANQTTLLDMYKTAKNMLEKFPSNKILAWNGYTLEDIRTYKKIIISNASNEAYKNGNFDIKLDL